MADSAVAYANCWPLAAACSIEVLHPRSPFVPEYVVPQQVLQWVVSDSDYDGVMYFSSKCQGFTRWPATCANYAFPSRRRAPTGYCNALRAKFEMTEPMPWALLQHANLPYTDSTNWNSELELAPGLCVPYLQTEFGTIEGKLAAIECTPL